MAGVNNPYGSAGGMNEGIHEDGHACGCAGEDSGHTAEKVRDAATDVMHRGAEKAKELGQSIQETAANVGHKAREAAHNMTEQFRESASHMTERADQVISGMGQRFTSAAEQIRQSVPRESSMGSAAVAFADNLEAGGHYLQEHKLEDMVNDASSLIRRHPVEAIFISLATGFVLGSAIKRR